MMPRPVQGRRGLHFSANEQRTAAGGGTGWRWQRGRDSDATSPKSLIAARGPVNDSKQLQERGTSSREEKQTATDGAMGGGGGGGKKNEEGGGGEKKGGRRRAHM